MTRQTPKTTCEWGKRRSRGRGEVWKASMVGGHPDAPTGIRVLCVPSSSSVSATAVTRTHPKRCLPPVHFSRSSQSMSPIRQTQSQINVANCTYRGVVHAMKGLHHSPPRVRRLSEAAASGRHHSRSSLHMVITNSTRYSRQSPQAETNTEDTRTLIGGDRRRTEKKNIPPAHTTPTHSNRPPRSLPQPFTRANRRATPRCGGGA